MLEILKRILKYVIDWWRSEIKRFIESRKELIWIKDYGILMVILLITWISWMLWFTLESSELVLITMIIFVIWMSFYLTWIWLAWLWGIFNIIPTWTDIIEYLDRKNRRNREWEWRYMWYKTQIENSVWDYVVRKYLWLTVDSWYNGTQHLNYGIRMIFKWEFEIFFLNISKWLWYLFLPLLFWNVVWGICLLIYMRISIKRLPIILLFMILLIWIFLLLFMLDLVWLFLVLWLILYSIIFIEIEDLFKVKAIYKVLYDRIRWRY